MRLNEWELLSLRMIIKKMIKLNNKYNPQNYQGNHPKIINNRNNNKLKEKNGQMQIKRNKYLQ